MALRKLQAEIDKTLKAIAQGVEVFEATFDKLNHATNTTQKDKFENDLKTQIKKLQRMRDQIKVWMGSSDIKDKTALLDNRKLIETQMERFKALEKEMKMKAFSKEGLIAQSRLDPAEKAKRDMVDWITSMTDEMSRQIEATEAEAELRQATKKKRSAGDRLAELDELNERRQWHIGRLEVVQRMLENGQLQMEQVETIQEDVKYFAEANTEEDFEYDAGIYDDLNLQEDEDYLQEFSHNDEVSNLDSASIADITEALPKTPAKEEKKILSKPQTTPTVEEPPSPVAVTRKPSRKGTMDSIKSDKDKDVKAIVDTPQVPKLPAKPTELSPIVPPPKLVALPPIRYAAAAAAAVSGVFTSASAPAAALPTVPAPTSAPTTQPADVPASPEQTKVEPPSVESPAVETVPSPVLSAAVAAPPPPILPKLETSAPLTNGHAPPPPPGLSRSPLPFPPTSAVSPASASQVAPPAAISPLPTLPLPEYAAECSRAASAAGFSSGHSPTRPQGILGNLMQSFDEAKQISERRTGNINEMHGALDTSYANAPQQLDAEPPRYYHAKNPFKTPSYYPQAKPPILDDKELFSRLELDQLFYIFYYMTGTYEQWLAARELKRQSWRFHKQYLTWFQRAHNPQAITEDYEQGGYLYFDWENSWCQRKKSDFRFEYRWLSEH